MICACHQILCGYSNQE